MWMLALLIFFNHLLLYSGLVWHAGFSKPNLRPLKTCWMPPQIKCKIKKNYKYSGCLGDLTVLQSRIAKRKKERRNFLDLFEALDTSFMLFTLLTAASPFVVPSLKDFFTQNAPSFVRFSNKMSLCTKRTSASQLAINLHLTFDT